MRLGKWRLSLTCRRAAAGLGILLGLGALAWAGLDLPSFAEVRSRYRPSDAWIVDRHGHPLESLRLTAEHRSLDWTPWADISPAFRDLLVEVEDRRFYSHPGVDGLALANAAWSRLVRGARRGASTITMQVEGLLRTRATRRRNFTQKLGQILGALKLEFLWTKDEILEAYVNLVPFRGELVGLRAASRGYFAKDPSGLVREEAALLVALLRSPNSAPERVAARACQSLRLTDCADLTALSERVLSKPYQLGRPRELVPVLAKEFVEGDETSSLIRTSLDFRIQDLALRALREQLHALHPQNVHDGAVLVLETRTGRVAAYVANSGANSASLRQIDGVQMQRQAGSTIKPFVFATALDWRLLRANSLLEDSPADLPISGGRVYHPRNYDHVFRGLVSVGEALGSSLNVPAVRALELVGEERVLDRLRALGFRNLQSDDYYGPSLALGSVDVSLWDLAHGYRQFATEASPFSGPTREAIFGILAAPEYRRFTFGMGGLLSLPFPAAVKTGTSKDMRDNWCLGWTSEYTVAVWVGNFNGEAMWNVSGMSGAAPVWRSLMLALHPNPPSAPLSYEAPAAPLPARTITRIRYPAAGMFVGIDPDIPLPLQKLPIEVENPQSGHQLFLNSRLLSRARATTLWTLKRGKYRVELKAESGELVDDVRFEVR